MHEEIEECYKINLVKNKLNIFDRFVLRSLNQKVIQKCVYHCCSIKGINKFKYEGRYPFKPILGCTEFLSALFSFLNLITNSYGYFKYLRNVTNNHPLAIYYKLTYLVNVLTWVSSTLFHINDTFVTRNLDYFFALLNLLFVFYSSFLRVLYSIKGKTALIYKNHIFMLILSLYFMHIYYMTFVNFDYNFHKLICGLLIVCTLSIYSFLIFKYSKTYHMKYLIIFSLVIGASCLIEVSDFPPFFYLFDSHALFHLVTGIFAPFYYLFLKEDLIYLEKLN
ncbi:hypothetical protein H312_00086 [Anncaliia algerae PRA339]|uniref:Post-GPI attachment to proteins factor 3 n=1 Tax=Anncaliia algerae PRA339 TaxID=1288291 RepID=A0A059F555_9MICR|nr:hypothetical protein H312_00086 [Anncaliia algerae PRA339]